MRRFTFDPAPAIWVIVFGWCLAGLGHQAVAQPVTRRLDMHRFISWSFTDPGRMARSVDGSTVLYTAGSLLVLGGISVFDHEITNTVRAHYAGPFKSYTDVVNSIGGPEALVPAVGLFGVSLLTKNRRFQDAAFTSVQALGVAGLVTIGLKKVAGRHRPADSASPYVFTPFSNESSFPSGHATAASALLVPWALYYPHPVTWTLVALGAGGTALARIARHKHWASDVLAGGLIGSTIAARLVHLHRGGRPLPETLRVRAGLGGVTVHLHF